MVVYWLLLTAMRTNHLPFDHYNPPFISTTIDDDFMTIQHTHIPAPTLDDTQINNPQIDFRALTDTATLPQPCMPPIKKATYKACVQDFVVNEQLDIDFMGEGEHLWLHIQKVGINTAYLAKLLSEWADIPLRDVGYSGLKDRHAVTTQWFSLRIPKKTLPEADFAPTDLNDHETITILAQHWHHKKLNRGTHRANQFIITLRDISFAVDTLVAENQQKTEAHLQHISKHGVPNYFGTQRFGYGGNNIKEALALFARPTAHKTASKKGKGKRAPREQNSMELSAARSLIFNHILAARVEDGSWQTGMAGEVFNLNGSGSIFASEVINDTLRSRLASGDIHPTAVLWGLDNDKVSGLAAQLEQNIIQQHAIFLQLTTGLEQRAVKAQRRALRLPIEALSWHWTDKNTLTLNFTLTTGSFATSVLASVVQQIS